MRPLAVTLLALAAAAAAAAARPADPPKNAPPVEEAPADPKAAKVVLIAGSNYFKAGEHEYVGGAAALMDLLRQTPGVAPVLAVDWPKKRETLAGAKAVVFFFDGGDKHAVTKEDRAAQVKQLAAAGVGIVQFHQAVDYPKDFADRARDWTGGAWEKGAGERAHWVAEFATFPDHPVCRGVTPFKIDDGWLWKIRFADGERGVTPLLRTWNPKATAKPEGAQDVIAWAFDRPNGGRAFSFTGGHLHASLAEEGYRRFLVNGILWSAGLEIPKGGAKVDLDPKTLGDYLKPPPPPKKPADPPKKGDGVFVGVGYGGRRLVSADGVKWEIAAEWSEKGGDDSDNLLSVVYGKGKFVAAGGGTPKRDKNVGGHILVSTDGREWKEVHTAKFRVHPVLFGNDRFVAGGPDRNFLYSADGETWKEGAKLTEKVATHYRHGAFGNGVFVFIGNNGGDSATTWVAVTKDGEKLEHIATDLPRVRGLAFGNGRFVVVGPDGLRMSSKDGVKWEHEARAEGAGLTAVVWTGTEFLATGAKPAYHSPDGVTWKEWPKPIPCAVRCVANGVYVGSSWPSQMWHSTDGLDWKKCDPVPPNAVNMVTHGGGK